MIFDNNIPIYLQVLEDLKKRMVFGEIAPGARLPAVSELALQYRVNPNTAQRIYRELEAEGLCFMRRGLGTFATEDAGRIVKLRDEMTEQLVISFLDGMESLGIPQEESLKLISQRISNREAGTC